MCTDCGITFRERWELHSHSQKIHDTRVFNCNICKKQVIGQRKMDGHKQRHKEKPCNICWKLFPVNSFSNHRAKCEGIVLHCDLCPYQTPKKQFLQKHIASIHKEKSPKIKEMFEMFGTNFKYTNREHHEALHHTLKDMERNRGLNMKKKHGSPVHQKKSLKSIVTRNVLSAGFIPKNKLRLRKSKTSSESSQSPRSSPVKSVYSSKKSLVNNFLDRLNE